MNRSATSAVSNPMIKCATRGVRSVDRTTRGQRESTACVSLDLYLSYSLLLFLIGGNLLDHDRDQGSLFVELSFANHRAITSHPPGSSLAPRRSELTFHLADLKKATLTPRTRKPFGIALRAALISLPSAGHSHRPRATQTPCTIPWFPHLHHSSITVGRSS